jgi:membrane peptidoglycan carboxypeptidase
MSADLPTANNNDNNDNNDNTAETSPMANGDNNAALDPVTPTDITLTRQQQRVLNYLARRRMRNAHITKRQTYADLMETRHNNNEPTPNPHTLPPITHETPIPDEPLPSPSELVTLDGEWVDPSDDPLWSPWNAGLTRDILKSHANNQHEAPFLLPEEDERPSALGIFSANTQPLKETPIPIPAEAPLAGPLTVRNSGILLPPLTYRPRSAKKAWRRKKVLRHIARKHMRAARVSEYRTHRRLWTMMGTIFLVLLLVFLSLGTAGSFAAYRFYYQTQNKYEHRVLSLRDLLPLDNLKMYDSKGVPLMQMTDQGLHTTVLLDEVAPIAINASIATEDKNFWTNQGIDILRILRAAIDNLRSGQVVEGGSTITQQLIKNLVVGNKTTFERKLEEVVLTPQINSLYTKHDILEMYLNSIYYGHQAYGIDAAATIYFGLEDKPGKRAAMQMDLAQAAMIAGIPSNPSAYDPLDHPKAAFQRFENVLGLMMSQQYITKVEALDAIKEAQSPHFFKTAPSLTDRAPHFANFVLDQLVQQFGLKNRSQLSRSGMIVYTTLDISLQDKIQKIAQKHIAELRAAHHLTNAAEVLIDFHTGAILSLLGSIDYNNTAINGQFDVATQGYRQPGSSFKPYVYVTAFKQGASPAQAIDDAPTTIDNAGGDPPFYSPTNYDLSYHGHMTLRCALQNSLNVPAVRVLKHVGIGASMQTAKEMGITSYQGTPGYSLVLGGLGIRLIDHTSAMGTFANGGVHVGYYAINKVVSGTSRKVIYQRQLNPGKRVISPQLAYMMTNVLSDNTARIPEFFDCNVLQLYSRSQTSCYNGDRGIVRPAAAKTGTTQNFRDNWTVGYTTDYVMGVWAGNNDNTPMYQVTGVQGAAPIWHDSMLVAEQGHPIRDFTNPGGLQQATVTYPDGVKTTDWFIPGTIPTSVQPIPTLVPTAGATPGPGTPTPTSTPLPISGPPNPSTAHPYCPSAFSFAFNPPPPSQSGYGWW